MTANNLNYEFIFSKSNKSSEQHYVPFKSKIAQWAVNNKIHLSSLSELLKLLKEEGHDVPLDARTLTHSAKIN